MVPISSFGICCGALLWSVTVVWLRGAFGISQTSKLVLMRPSTWQTRPWSSTRRSADGADPHKAGQLCAGGRSAAGGGLKILVTFVGVGETVEDLQPFDSTGFVEGMFPEIV